MSTRDTIAVIGTGMMGPGISARSALAGNKTKLFSRSPERAAAGLDKARYCIRQLLDNEIVSKSQAQNANELLESSTDFERELGDVFWVIEAITENLSNKQELFTLIDAIAPAGGDYYKQHFWLENHRDCTIYQSSRKDGNNTLLVSCPSDSSCRSGYG